MLERHDGEVCDLDRGPHHAVRFVSGPPAFLQLFDRVGAFHDRHGREKHKHVGGSKDSLVGKHSRGDGRFLALQDDVVLEELEPGGGSRTEDSYSKEHPLARLIYQLTTEEKAMGLRELTAAVETHPASPGKVMLIDPLFLDYLLRENISR